MAETGSVDTGVRFLDIDAEQAGQRIDNFLLARLKGVPKSRIYRLLRKGEVRVNKGRIKPEYRLRDGDVVRLPPVRTSTAPPPPEPGAGLRARLEAGVLLENDKLLVVDKPSGLAVHGGSGVSLGLIEALRAARGEPGLELVHRLDRDTSGCVLVARKRSALRDLQTQMREQRIGKRYLALVAGAWPRGRESVDAPLDIRARAGGEKFVRAAEGGKRAVTHFRVLRRLRNATLLEVELETGRTHQIRVHCRLAGHPVLGDDKYGDEAANRRAREAGLKRLFLHARTLRFAMPGSGEPVTVEAPLPDELETCFERL